VLTRRGRAEPAGRSSSGAGCASQSPGRRLLCWVPGSQDAACRKPPAVKALFSMCSAVPASPQKRARSRAWPAASQACSI